MVCSSESPRRVQAYHGPLGQRLVVRGAIGTLLRYTQTLTLWRGLARVDCRTTIDEFVGEDRLVRLRWPCPVPGAMPVSEVGDAAVGRGFALLHKVSGGPASVDTAEHLRTLDNPAYSWFGLSSAARVCVDDSVRAVSVAEVVSPAEASSGPLARDLMVALVRAGVTATCSGADKPRYGDLGVDSNLPDTRIALGGPARNAFTKAVLAQADPVYAKELDRQLAESGRARVWVPAADPLASVWLPGADLRAARSLPVLVIDGSDDETPGRRDRIGGRRPRRRPDRRQPAGPGGNGTFRCPHRRAAQPRSPELRRRERRHPAHRADAVLHRLAVRRLDRRCWPCSGWRRFSSRAGAPACAGVCQPSAKPAWRNSPRRWPSCSRTAPRCPRPSPWRRRWKAAPRPQALAHWRQLVEAGQGKPAEWTGDSRPFPPLFLWLVQKGGEDVAAGFQKAAEIYQARASYRIELALYGALPVSILLLGQMVLWQAIPLVRSMIWMMNMLGSELAVRIDRQ